MSDKFWSDMKLPPINLHNAPKVKNSPCVGICKLNDKNVCEGCNRHIDVISSAYTNKQHRQENQE